MREDLGQRLFLRCPMWFDVQGFEHGNGWFDILWRLLADLRPPADELQAEDSQPFAVLWVQEKRGGLRA